MTLIAGFVKNMCPILMGDLLLSDSEQSDKILNFPTVGTISKNILSNGDYKPSSLCQKVVLIGPNLCICWANKKIYAKRFIKEILDAKLHENFSYEALSEIYYGIGGEGNLSIIGLYIDETEFQIFEFSAWPVDSPHSEFEYFKSAGSGYGTLLDIMPNIGRGVSSGNPNKLDIGIATALSICSSLFAYELQNQLTLHNLFGGGYEIVHPLGRNLTKFSDVTYVFWNAEELTQGRWGIIPFPTMVFKYSYIKDFLIIRSAKCSSNKNTNSCIVDRDDLHIINPIHKNINPDELVDYTPQSFNSKYISNIFLWKNKKNETGAYFQLGRFVTQKPPIIWSNEFKKNEGIDYNFDFIQSSFMKIIAMSSEK